MATETSPPDTRSGVLSFGPKADERLTPEGRRLEAAIGLLNAAEELVRQPEPEIGPVLDAYKVLFEILDKVDVLLPSENARTAEALRLGLEALVGPIRVEALRLRHDSEGGG